MVSVVLGSKIADFSFDIFQAELETLQSNKPDYTITKSGDIMISESKSDYVVLSGSFNWSKILSGDYDSGVKKLDGITIVESGKVVYTASGLGMTGAEVVSDAVLQDSLAERGYGIKGNVFANEIEAGDRNDIVHGLGGNDTIDGLSGIDKLYGEAGADRITGGLGADILVGGSGADVFVFVSGDGDDVIVDFHASGKGQDHIDFSGHGDVSSFEDLDISTAGKNVVITAGDDTIVLKHVSEHNIDASDFIF